MVQLIDGNHTGTTTVGDDHQAALGGLRDGLLGEHLGRGEELDKVRMGTRERRRGCLREAINAKDAGSTEGSIGDLVGTGEGARVGDGTLGGRGRATDLER